MENNFSYNLNPRDLPEEIKKESKHLSFVFFTFAASYVVSLIFILTLNAFLYAVDIPQGVEYVIRSILSAIHTPFIFFIMYKVFKKRPSAIVPVSDKMSLAKLVKFLCVCIFFMISGSLIGNFVTDLISSLTGRSVGSVVSDIVKSMEPLEVFILAVIVGPVFEELVFRKLLIDNLYRYGTVFACTVSALVFGLYHGNFEQFFYAFFVGIILSYVYCVYGKIMYPIILHVILNAVGSFVPLCIGFGETTEITLFQMIYLYFYIFSFISGGFIFISKFKESLFYVSDGCLIKPWRVLFKNFGFICTVVISILIFVYNII